MKFLCLHLGYSKTATTWLQENVWPDFPGIKYLGFRFDPAYYYQIRLTDHLALLDDIEASPEMVHDTFDGLAEDGAINVFSSEALLTPYAVERTAQRIREVFADWEISIVIGIRRQPELIFSEYLHNLRSPLSDAILRSRSYFQEPQPYPAWEIEQCLRYHDETCAFPCCEMSLRVAAVPYKSHRPCSCLQEKVIRQPLWYYDFNRVISLYENVFGADSVHVFTFEQLKDSPAEVLKRFDRFLGTHAEPALLEQLAEREKVNTTPWNEKSLNVKWRFEHGNNCVRDQLLSCFLESNQKLDKRRPELDLRRWDYYTPLDESTPHFTWKPTGFVKSAPQEIPRLA